jgi:hypothetical protein
MISPALFGHLISYIVKIICLCVVNMYSSVNAVNMNRTLNEFILRILMARSLDLLVHFRRCVNNSDYCYII